MPVLCKRCIFPAFSSCLHMPVFWVSGSCFRCGMISYFVRWAFFYSVLWREKSTGKTNVPKAKNCPLGLWNGEWRGHVGYYPSAFCCEQEICCSQWAHQCFLFWSITTILALKWGASGVKIITKQITSVPAISSILLISCFFYLVPHKQL